MLSDSQIFIKIMNGWLTILPRSNRQACSNSDSPITIFSFLKKGDHSYMDFLLPLLPLRQQDQSLPSSTPQPTQCEDDEDKDLYDNPFSLKE